MIHVHQNGDHQTVMSSVLENMGYSIEAIEAMGVYNIALISLLTPELLECYTEIATDNTEYLIGLLKEHGTMKAPLYFLQVFMNKWDNTAIRNYAVKKGFKYEELLQEHWDQTVEELKDETYMIIAE